MLDKLMIGLAVLLMVSIYISLVIVNYRLDKEERKRIEEGLKND